MFFKNFFLMVSIFIVLVPTFLALFLRINFLVSTSFYVYTHLYVHLRAIFNWSGTM